MSQQQVKQYQDQINKSIEALSNIAMQKIKDSFSSEEGKANFQKELENPETLKKVKEEFDTLFNNLSAMKPK